MRTSTLTIDLGDRSYPILIGRGLLNQAQLIAERIAGNQVLIVSNQVVASHYLDAVDSACESFQTEHLILPDGEEQKSHENWLRGLDRLADMRANRDVTLIALGGGVIGDLTGFVAASWMRGVPFLQIPTTLLAQVDASVGGKTAINHAAGKNLIGAFHQPCGVIIDTDTLSTLPSREFRAGLAEIVKYGLIRDRPFFEWIDDQAQALLSQDSEAMTETIERCCRHKAEIVARDERESGVRALLNLGHSFAHAIEAVAGFGQILHGEAVAIGCCASARLSAELGRCPIVDAIAIEKLFERLGLPVRIPLHLASTDLLDAMRLDKKNLSGRLRLVLMSGIGNAHLSEDAPDDMILALLDDLR